MYIYVYIYIWIQNFNYRSYYTSGSKRHVVCNIVTLISKDFRHWNNGALVGINVIYLKAHENHYFCYVNILCKPCSHLVGAFSWYKNCSSRENKQDGSSMTFLQQKCLLCSMLDWVTRGRKDKGFLP